MVKEAEGAEGAEGAGGEVFWLSCLIMVNYPDLISPVTTWLSLTSIPKNSERLYGLTYPRG